MPTRAQRLEGGLVGLLVGDALGVPYEFHRPDALPPRESIEFTPPRDFQRAHRGTPPGTWSDDGAHALCLLASLLDCGRLDPADLGTRLLRWHDRGYLAVDARVFDVGIQTSRAIEAIRRGTRATEAGPAGERDNGNGSLMRALPLALWHRGSDADLIADAETQSRVTHGHVRARVCCAMYCIWARRFLDGAEDPWGSATAALRAHYANDSPATEALEWHVRPDEPADGGGTGYVVDCLKSARMAMDAGNYEAVVRAAIALGHDTDTTACVAGGIAGVRDGIEAIPIRWRAELRGVDILEPLRVGLLARG